MLSIAKSIKTGLYNYVVRVGRTRVRRDLLGRDDRFLADTGFSRELLEQGIDAWPWRIDKRTDNKDNAVILSYRDVKKAVAELNACSDAELADLGISRGSIELAVRYGRPGLDQDEHRNAA